MDFEAIARAQRRRQALEAIEFQRHREAALQEQLEAIVAEVQGPRIDEAAFIRMAPEDVELARGILESGLESVESDLDSLDKEWVVEEETPENESEDYEAELGRLQGEIADTRRLQQALRSYVEALGE
jgi:chromosome segregation ATPase